MQENHIRIALFAKFQRLPRTDRDQLHFITGLRGEGWQEHIQ